MDSTMKSFRTIDEPFPGHPVIKIKKYVSVISRFVIFNSTRQGINSLLLLVPLNLNYSIVRVPRCNALYFFRC